MNGLNSHNIKQYLKGLSDINAPIWEGLNALHLSIFGKNFEIIKFILSLGADPNCKVSFATVEISKNDIKPDENITLTEPLTEELLEEINSLGNISAIHIAVKNCSPKITKLLLEYNADPNVFDQGECTPLHWAIAKNDQQTAKLLLNHKANPNVQDIVGSTPLHEAIRKNNVEMIKLLLDNNCDVNIKDRFDQNALDLSKNNLTIYNLLFKKN